LGVHFFDQLRYVAGEVATVSARCAVVEPRRVIRDASGQAVREIDCDADDTFVAHLEMASGAVGSLYATWGGHGGPIRTGEGTVYYGDRARISGNEITLDGTAPQNLRDLFRRDAPAALQSAQFPGGLEDSFALAQLDWLQTIAAGRQPETSGREGLRDLATAFALLESDCAGRPVRVADVLEGRIDEFQRPLNAHFGLSDW
jgi:predicted dehydrogenase